MTLGEYQNHLKQLPFGKELPTAVYVFWEAQADFGKELNLLLATLAARLGLGTEFNIIKFRTDELKISFLSYPDFMAAAHPALRHAVTVDLVTGKARHTDYAANHNPPILHRKETFLPADHPRRPEFAALTRAEEDAGLYEQTATIGFKLNWKRLMSAKGLRIEGHALRTVEGEGAPHPASSHPEAEKEVVVDRHKTALMRYELSKPVKTLLEYGLLKPDTTFFDYGCGQGGDMRGLQALGHEAEGWDPVHRAQGSKHEADIVNLGYVLNVIEDPAERLEALVDAQRHCRKLLVVSGLINETVDVARARQYSDGVLTRANTFQKFFEQQELQQYIEDALDTTAVPVALGVFYVFRNPAEFVRIGELREKIGSPKQALRLFILKGGGEEVQRAAESRKRDLLVYVALANLRKRVPFGHLSASLRADIRAFFSNYTHALKQGVDLLYAAGDTGEIELACEDLKLGWQDEQALYLHRSLLDELPPVLRAYVGCATALFGDVSQADIIKLHKASGKATFLVYDGFEGKPLPELRQRIKVNLRTRWVQVFDHSAERQLLYFKERFVSANHPGRATMENFSAKVRKLGFDEATIGRGPLRGELDALLAAKGLNENLNPRRRIPRPTASDENGRDSDEATV